VEALTVNRSVNQSEKAVRAGFRHRNRAVFYSTSETGTGKNWMSDCMTHAPESCVEFMALISGPFSGACVRGFRPVSYKSAQLGTCSHHYCYY